MFRQVLALRDRLTRHTASALVEDAKLGLSNVRPMERIAVVTEIAHFGRLVKGAASTLPVAVKLFSNAERAEAEAWVSEGL